MCLFEKLTGVAILLATLCISSLSTGSNNQECNIHDSFTSPNIEAFYEQEVAISGCQSSQTVATSKEVHVINLLSAPELVQPGQRVNVSLNVQQARTVRGSNIIFVLNSAIPVTWVLTTDRRRSLPIFNYRIEIPQNTSIVYNDDMVVDLKDDKVLPQANSDLLEWVTDYYQAVTTFSAVHGANTINLKLGEEYVVPNPSICNIQNNFAATNVEAYFVQDKAITGCEVDQTSKTSSVRQVHVVELHSASHEPIGATPPRVIVDLTPITRGKEHLYNVVLVLKADVEVSWDVRSVTVSGKLEILSPNTQMEHVGFHSKSQKTDRTGMPETGADLVERVAGEYGAVASYIEADLANHFRIIVKESTNTDGLPQGPKTISNEHVLGVPVLERIANIECFRDSISVTIPKDIINYFGLYQENVMFADPSCEAEIVGNLLILESGLDECGTKKIVQEDKIIYENEVIFTDTEYPGDDEGSGSSTTDPANIGNPPADDDNQPIERFPIKCEYKPNGEPITELPPQLDPEGFNDIGRSEDSITLLMDLYQSPTFTRTVQSFPVFTPRGKRLFFQVGLEGSDQMKVVPNHCWIAPGGSPVPVIIHELIVDGCPADKTIVYHNTDSYNIRIDNMWVKQFSFQVPILDSDLLDFYVHCELGVCSEDGSGLETGVPMCSDVLAESVSAKCLVDTRKLVQGPLQRLNVGALQTNRGDPLPATQVTPQKYDNRIIIQGLSAGPAAAVAFAAFAMGVLLTACLWFIHAHTGPRTEPPASPQTVSTPSSPSGNGHILNGHIPNGFLMNGAVGNGYVPNGGINPNRIPAHGMMHGDPNAEEMV